MLDPEDEGTMILPNIGHYSIPEDLKLRRGVCCVTNKNEVYA
jgi:hypothetical protein